MSTSWLLRTFTISARFPARHRRSCPSCCRYARLASTAAMAPASADNRKAFSHTLLLPKTDFPLKHRDIVAAEQRYRAKTSDELYKHQIKDQSRPTFILHDGPPYANGHLHMGHALNKVLKDIINRYQLLIGHRVHYVPGWDCHGLPIEQKALKDLGKSHTSLPPSRVRSEARKVAMEAIDIQKTEMRALGVMADWDGPNGTYRTLDHDFEIRQLKLFTTMVGKGMITHRLRPTYYSPSSRTALAEAELKYKDGHKSRSVYVKFAVADEDMSPPLRALYRQVPNAASLSLAIWTTTPWTLPGNSGVTVHNDLVYAVVTDEAGHLLVVGEDRLDALRELFPLGPIVGVFKGSELVGTRYTHPFHLPSSSEPRPMIFASRHVTSDAGTGLVHSAPAHGYEDYIAFSDAGLLPKDLRCPVDADGRLTDEVVQWGGRIASELVGKSVLGEGVDLMVDLLKTNGTLLAEQTIEHRYPHDWKTKQPVIVRATPQWFADVESIKQEAITALSQLTEARNRLEAFVLSRSEWCISRQRSWGVPIPILFGDDGHPLLNQNTMDHAIRVLDEKGVDHWWSGPIEDFLPPSLHGQAVSRSYDTLDVWFDSGSSWTLLEEAELRSKDQTVADIYLEGSDQHRGWFQSSLLTKLIGSMDKRAPYNTVITHGFVMDEQGEKMSKSAGNGLSPMDIVHGNKKLPAYGTDVLRLWTALVDYTNDAAIGPTSIAQAAEIVRKIRNSTRFLLANSAQAGPLDRSTLRLIDRYVLHELAALEGVAREAYDAFAFNKVVHATTSFLSNTLSALYFDVIKDTLYSDGADSQTRQDVTAVLRYTLGRVNQIIAPITPHLAEELYEHSTSADGSVFSTLWEPGLSWIDASAQSDMSVLLAFRSAVQKLGEEARTAKSIKSLVMAECRIYGPASATEVLERNLPTLTGLFGTSTVVLDRAIENAAAPRAWEYSSEMETADGLIKLTLVPSSAHECPRCWQYTSEVKDGLCARCDHVLQLKS